jgi:hypothetical protein
MCNHAGEVKYFLFAIHGKEKQEKIAALVDQMLDQKRKNSLRQFLR